MDLCTRLLDSTASVAASDLEQPTWFRRTLQVKQAPVSKPMSSNPSGGLYVSGQTSASGSLVIGQDLLTSMDASVVSTSLPASSPACASHNPVSFSISSTPWPSDSMTPNGSLAACPDSTITSSELAHSSSSGIFSASPGTQCYTGDWQHYVMFLYQ
ncbi:unnamed protein product [Protopolystoma xenopodis]|uniref:Uncharacterized protein n=1 Tax=Protopolystoma xenopodis TaxID=117903 RepID=A0A3S5CQA9_9PLAT|nr:unnamed protein product [Protopolystoma xenopodis]